MTGEWVFLVEAFNDVEAAIILGLLESGGIPARKADDPFAGAMRVIGGQAYEVRIMVPESYLEQARALLRSAARENENGATDEE